MKIALPVDIQSGEGLVYASFARAPYFAVYDTQTKEITYAKNQAAVSPGGAGIAAAQWIINQHIAAIISPRLGENAERVLKEANIVMYQSISGSILENIQAHLESKLTMIQETHPGFHSHRR